MRTVQMTLDDDLLEEVDLAAKRLRTSRSALARQALRESLAKYNAERLERKHRRGYEKRPVRREEFGVWETEQAWGDE